jgi:hypothetical protein
MNEEKTPRAFRFQVACDGDWRRPLVCELSASVVENQRKVIGLFERETPQDLAFELFFRTKDGDLAFLGVRLIELPRAGQRDRLLDLLTQVRNAATFGDTLRVAERVLRMPMSTRDPDFKELGFEGLWRAGGPQLLWERGQLQPALGYDDLILKAPQYARKHEKPAMIELAWRPCPEQGRKHGYWIACQVSGEFNGAFELSSLKYSTVLASSGVPFVE